MAVTINDVAKHADVSIATVSRVVNGRGSVNEQLKKRVVQAIEQLGYVPNSNAQALKQDCSRLIGITASDLSVAFFPELVKRVEKMFLQDGYATIVSSTYDEPKNERIVLEHMVSRRVDALLVNSTGQNEALLRQIAAAGTPVIFYDRREREQAFPTVYMDKTDAIRQAMEHLYALGHRRIALVTGPEMLTSNADRYAGFRSFAQSHGLTQEACPALFGSFSEEYGMEAMHQIMRMPDRPTAVITGSISITAGVMRYCHERGVSIPGDIALVSSGNFIYASALNRGLTYMDDRTADISDGIIRLLSRVLSGEAIGAADQIVLDARLIVGQSTVG